MREYWHGGSSAVNALSSSPVLPLAEKNATKADKLIDVLNVPPLSINRKNVMTSQIEDLSFVDFYFQSDSVWFCLEIRSYFAKLQATIK